MSAESTAAQAGLGATLYRSTRGGGAAVPFEAALLRGPAEDGGLYVPVDLPALPAGWSEATSMAELAERVLPPFMGLDGARAVAGGLDFPVPLVRLGQDFVLELFHGPTAAFKDVGARSLARLMQLALERSGGSATILVATSGDTGSAVADAFAGLGRIQVALLYPKGGVSRVQENQLITARPGLRSFAVRGTFDDCQRMVKEAFADPALAPLELTSANSINVGRLLPQMLYYLWGAKLARDTLGADAPLSVVVPSGNLGNLTAGIMANRMGLTGLKFVAAHNRNDYFARYLAGRAEPYEFAPSVTTLSNAMDVGAPSNFERLHALLGDSLRDLVQGEAVDDAATLARMRRTHERFGYLACPHTAVGLEAWARLTGQEGGAGSGGAEAGGTEDGGTATGGAATGMILATAHPAKFPEAVMEATGVKPETPASLAAFEAAPKRVEEVDATLADLRTALLDRPDFSA